MGDEDIRKRSILKQTAAYLPAQMPETRPSYINSQDFELFQFVDAFHIMLNHRRIEKHRFRLSKGDSFLTVSMRFYIISNPIVQHTHRFIKKERYPIVT